MTHEHIYISNGWTTCNLKSFWTVLVLKVYQNDRQVIMKGFIEQNLFTVEKLLPDKLASNLDHSCYKSSFTSNK